MFRGASYADNFQYQRCIDLWIYAFELRIQKHTLLHNESSFALQALIKLCLDFYEKQKNGLLKAKLQYDDMLFIFKCLNFHLPSSIQALTIRPVFKNQQDNFDVTLKVKLVFFSAWPNKGCESWANLRSNNLMSILTYFSLIFNLP